MVDLIDIPAAAAAMDKTIARQQGISLIDGTFNGYALLIGNPTDLKIIEDLTKRKILVFVTGEGLKDRLKELGQDLNWGSGFVGRDLPQALGFIYRVASVFRGSEDADVILTYAREKLMGFTLLLGEPTPEELSAAYATLSLGCPVLAVPELPADVKDWQTYDGHPAGFDQLSAEEIVQLGIEKRGMKITFALPDLPVEIGSEFSGQVVRDDDCGVCLTGVEFTTIGEEITDGQVLVVGDDLDSGLTGVQPYGVLVEVGGEEMQPDFEPVLEREIDTILNEVDGSMHRGQRTIASLRISKKVLHNGLTLRQLGDLIHARYHNEFGNVLTRVQVTFYTRQPDVDHLADQANAIFQARDRRLLDMTDEDVDTFYTCTTCQSIAGTHVCVISPEHPGVCGAVDWLDARAGVGIRPYGPNKPVSKEGELEPRLGQWEAVNQLVKQESGGGLEAYSLYSMMQDPGPACGDFDCITAMLPMANGVMVVARGYKGMTPSGMDWETLYEMVASGLPVPGFIGHSKRALHRDKFISAEGGWRRIVWMNYDLREELRPVLDSLAAREGIEGFVDLIATEHDLLGEEGLIERLPEVNHPVLGLDAII